MGTPYRAVFLIPLGATKVLDEDGWNFTSNERLPTSILAVLTQGLGFKILETYLGIDVYQCATMKANVTHDEQGRIEFVDFQVFDGDVAIISNALEQAGLLGTVEIFVPSSLR